MQRPIGFASYTRAFWASDGPTDKGQTRPIRLDDILVVSPYNMQVNLLRSGLPTGALVGTVDKFQGQEAAVVLISMATSSGDDLPRQIEFLYSRTSSVSPACKCPRWVSAKCEVPYATGNAAAVTKSIAAGMGTTAAASSTISSA
jgi:AAA domain